MPMNPSLLAAKVALGPVLLPQSLWVRRRAMRLPEATGPRAGTVGTGGTPLRVLVVGDSSAAGVGVADQAQALALPLAHFLAGRLAARVDWQLVARSGINTAEARALVGEVDLQPADVVVTALGVNDVTSQTTAQRFIEETAALWSDLQQLAGVRWGLFSGLPPFHVLRTVPHPLRWYLARYADWLDSAVREWTQQNGLGYCELRWISGPDVLAEDGFHPGAKLYPQWAQHLSELLAQEYSRWAPPAIPSVRAEPFDKLRTGSVEAPAPSLSVRAEPVEAPDRPELVEGAEPVEAPDRPELVEGAEPVEAPDRPELVEGAEPVEAPVPSLSVRAEPVEARVGKSA